VKYDNIYSFIYSKRTGTKAAEIDDIISDDVKSQRMRELLEVQREITTAGYRRFIGKKMRVLVDGESKKRKGCLTGKSNEFIIAEFEGDKSLIGSFVDIVVEDSMNWAVTGKII
jgi:tRNA-2-methylthio-N6-dimethylallyladenosine synthase